MAFKLKKDFNFGEGTSPLKIGWKAWLAGEGYYKAIKHQIDKRNKKRQDKEQAKKMNEHINRAHNSGQMPTSATDNMVQVWDEKLGRKKWVYQEDKKEKKEETKEPTTNNTKVKNNKPNNKPEKSFVVDDSEKKNKKKIKPNFRYNF